MTRTEIQWLQGKLELSEGYSRKIKSEIRKKLRIYNELEFSLLVKSGFIIANANCNLVTTDCNMKNLKTIHGIEIPSQNMVGREELV